MKEIIVLVDEFPKNCCHCDFGYEEDEIDFQWCAALGGVSIDYDYDAKCRDKKCPLKLIPQKKEVEFPQINIEKNEHVNHFIKPVELKALFKYVAAKGYNKAIEKIVGEEE